MFSIQGNCSKRYFGLIKTLQCVHAPRNFMRMISILPTKENMELQLLMLITETLNNKLSLRRFLVLLSERTLRMLLSKEKHLFSVALPCSKCTHTQNLCIKTWGKEGKMNRKNEKPLHKVAAEGTIKRSFLTLICSSYLIERPLSQSKPNLIRWITSRLGKTLMQVLFTVVLLKRNKNITSMWHPRQSAASF